jgi:hypothetical protein
MLVERLQHNPLIPPDRDIAGGGQPGFPGSDRADDAA